MLNKKDVTILVAPEQGKELDAREVAKRVMKAAEKNSKAFIRNNAKSAERKQSLDVLNTEIAGLETECKDLEKQLEVARIAAETAAIAPVEPESAPVIINGNTYTEINPDESAARAAFNEAVAKHDGNLFNAAKDVYQNTLQGRYVKTKIGNVLITGSGWREIKQGLNSDTIRVSGTV